MARLARAVFPAQPHHVSQHGNGRQQTFFSDKDYAPYHDLLAEHTSAAGLEVWAGVLMPNHVHLVLVPQEPDDLRQVLPPFIVEESHIAEFAEKLSKAARAYEVP